MPDGAAFARYLLFFAFRANPTLPMPIPTTLSPWPARLAYAAALLTVVWFFQHKMAEQARLHRMLTAVAPLAVEVVEEGSGDLYRRIFTQVNGYPVDGMLLDLQRAQAVLREARNCYKALEGLHEKSSSEQAAVFQEQIEGMTSFSDSILTYCGSVWRIQEYLPLALPAYSDTLQKQLVSYFSKADRAEVEGWADVLRLRYALASNLSMNYLRASVSGGEGHWAGPFLEWHGLQTCPVAGDMVKADIYWSFRGSSDYYPDHVFEVNGVTCNYEKGKWTYQNRFDTPGVHQLTVQGRIFDAWDSTLIQICSRTFEVRVQPGHDLSTPKN